MNTSWRLRLASLAGCTALAMLAQATAIAQESVLQRLNETPRHLEWAEIQHGDRTVHAFVAYPEVSEKTMAVVIIHENRGLTDWVRGVADQVAEAGYIAVAPDLLSGLGPGGGKTSDFPNENAARDALSTLPPEQVIADLHAVTGYAKGLDAANGRVAVAGFCWGGAKTFEFAAERPDLAAAFVFYGSAIDEAKMARIQAPVYGFYGENDARITSAVPAVAEKMQAAGKTFDQVTYDEAGHGFMRSGEDAPAGDPNRKARDAGWERWKRLLAEANRE